MFICFSADRFFVSLLTGTELCSTQLLLKSGKRYLNPSELKAYYKLIQ